jgi:hypothetical protein
MVLVEEIESFGLWVELSISESGIEAILDELEDGGDFWERFLGRMRGNKVGNGGRECGVVGWGGDFGGSECLRTSRRGEKDRPAPFGGAEEKEDCRRVRCRRCMAGSGLN